MTVAANDVETLERVLKEDAEKVLSWADRNHASEAECDKN